MFGVEESSNGTPRSSRTKKDMEACTEILQHTNNDISFQSIRDCFRLGKYNPNRSKPRPILVKLAQAFDADIALHNRSKIPNEILIKPDMNPKERKIEAALLSERWKLISSGVDLRDIKIKGYKLLVKGKKHGEVVNFKFVTTTSIDINDSSLNNSTPTDEQSSDN